MEWLLNLIIPLRVGQEGSIIVKEWWTDVLGRLLVAMQQGA